jgi:FlaA1/EpsC-like NDP-sugar epimerase
MKSFKDKKILVIGGTGSIGGKITKELLKQNPEVIRVYSRDEYKQFIMQQEMSGYDKLRFLVGDVRDYDRLERALQDIDIVFHTGAMKHVPACEYNPFEAVKTNVIGTQNVINAAIECNVKRVVFTSSDKAVSPPNAMGATKLLAEKLISAANYTKGSAKTIFSAVRFGNVMGSRGSVINLFKDQIKSKGKITVTDPDMTRFMMTLSEAANLTMKAVLNSKGGEVFVLKMPVIRLGDLAEIVIEETCKKIGVDPSSISTEIIGLRPGEKMYEELMTLSETYSAYDIGDMYSITSPLHEVNFDKIYGEYPKADHSYVSSANLKPMSKEFVRNMVLGDELI